MRTAFSLTILLPECVEDYDLIDEDKLKMGGKIAGEYFLGVDFGKKVDYSVIALLKKDEKELLKLAFLKQFSLGTLYTDVVDYLQWVDQKFNVSGGYADQGNIRESLLEGTKEFAPHVEGLTFTAKVKQYLMTLLQTRWNKDGLPFR